MNNNFIIMATVMIGLICLQTQASNEPALESSLSSGAQESPYNVLKNSGEKLFNRITESQQELEKLPQLMRKIVEEELLPVIDYKYISYRILGKHLRKSTKEQRKRFVEAMRKNIIRSYAFMLKRYKNQSVIFEPEKPVKNERVIAVAVMITEINKPTVDMSFKLRKQKNSGKWLIFDVIVEGISMLSTKQSVISRRISRYGLEEIIKEVNHTGN